MGSAEGRVVIFECLTGSHLYGTATASSDTDYLGVFAPSLSDHFGLQGCPSEWGLSEKVSAGQRNSAGDVDRKLYSLRRFVQLAAEGQPAQLEALFAPPDKVLVTTPTWGTLLASRHLLLSRRGVAPFLGFATAQAHKASVKGANLNLVRALLAGLEGRCARGGGQARVEDLLEVVTPPEADSPGGGVLTGCRVTLLRNSVEADTRPLLVEVAGRRWDCTVTVKLLCEGLRKLERAYGTRAQDAARDCFDYKAVLHVVRLLGEAEEYLRTGSITLPRPPEVVAELMRIRRKEWPAPGDDVSAHLRERVAAVRRAESASPLPVEPDWGELGRLCVELHVESLRHHFSPRGESNAVLTEEA